MSYRISKFGWQPDLPDHRDFTYSVPRVAKKILPVKIDLRNQCPTVYDQGQLGSCTANAIAAAFEFELLKQSPARDFMPSRLFIYYNERVIEHTVSSDAGAQIRDGMKSVNKQGVCNEISWHIIFQNSTNDRMRLVIRQLYYTRRYYINVWTENFL